jgi:acid phosphatase
MVPLDRFQLDLAAGRLPSFSLVVPDLCHDMHDCPVRTGDRWLAAFVRPLLGLGRSVVFVVFDEGASSIGGGGRVAALALGPLVRPHSRFTGATNHYGLLRTIEEGLGLSLLGRSAHARAITGIWQ